VVNIKGVSECETYGCRSLSLAVSLALRGSWRVNMDEKHSMQMYIELNEENKRSCSPFNRGGPVRLTDVVQR